MKKYIMLVSAAALLVPDVFAMYKSSRANQNSVSNITKKQKLKRVDSRARLPILKDKDQLPAPMSTEEYIDMLKKFLNENNQLIDPKELIEDLDSMKLWLENKNKWLSDLQQDFSFDPKDYSEYESFINEHEALFYQREEQTNPHLPKNTKIIDLSCPNIMIWAFKIIVKDKISEENPTNISRDKYLKWSHVAWLVKYFAKHVNKIQAHEIDPDDKYDSGLTDDEIDLLINLSVGPNRVFDISAMTKSEQNEFTEKILSDILRNATGFQRILSLLIVSTIWHEFKQDNWQSKISFGSGGGSHQYNGKIYFDKTKLDYYIPFHEISHFFHRMIIPNTRLMDLITNISIVNSRDINLIEQFFPMLRPSVMNPILRQIENLIDRYWGRDFEKVTEEEKQKIAIVVLEPIIRKAMTSGFGKFIFPNYETNQSLKMSVDMLTTQRVAMCLYLSGILEYIMMTVSKTNPIVICYSNTLSPYSAIQHPVFKEVTINILPITRNNDLLSTTECCWTSNEERLTMQGSSLMSINKTDFYIQDRQNEHIYRIRSQNQKNLSYSIADQFRYHERSDPRFSFMMTSLALINCCQSLNLKYETDFKDLEIRLKKAFDPSAEVKYTTSKT